jgi:chaperone LolA
VVEACNGWVMKKISAALLLTASFLVGHPAFGAARGVMDAALKPDMEKGAAQQVLKDTRSMAEKVADIARVEAYLATISSIVADFSQTSADGSSGTGKFFMKRPGKMRWQYNPPNPILLVSDGKTVTYYDPSLDQLSYVSVDDTLASFLAKRDMKFDSDSTQLTKFEAVDGLVSATIIQRKKPTEGNLTLEFSDRPLELKKIIAVDATGNETRVSLDKAQFGPVLDDKLFAFVDPRGVNHKRKDR